MAALVVHREAGRLSSTQFEDRQVLAEGAQTWADLERLFVDLPPPHPQRPVPPPVPVGAYDPPAGSSTRIDWGPRVAAAMPLIAVLLYFITRNWLVFLLIPIVLILVRGPGKRG